MRGGRFWACRQRAASGKPGARGMSATIPARTTAQNRARYMRGARNSRDCASCPLWNFALELCSSWLWTATASHRRRGLSDGPAGQCAPGTSRGQRYRKCSTCGAGTAVRTRGWLVTTSHKCACTQCRKSGRRRRFRLGFARGHPKRADSSGKQAPRQDAYETAKFGWLVRSRRGAAQEPVRLPAANFGPCCSSTTLSLA